MLLPLMSPRENLLCFMLGSFTLGNPIMPLDPVARIWLGLWYSNGSIYMVYAYISWGTCPNIVFKHTCTPCRPLRSNFVDNLRGFQSQNKLKKAGLFAGTNTYAYKMQYMIVYVTYTLSVCHLGFFGTGSTAHYRWSVERGSACSSWASVIFIRVLVADCSYHWWSLTGWDQKAPWSVH